MFKLFRKLWHYTDILFHLFRSRQPSTTEAPQILRSSESVAPHADALQDLSRDPDPLPLPGDVLALLRSKSSSEAQGQAARSTLSESGDSQFVSPEYNIVSSYESHKYSRHPERSSIVIVPSPKVAIQSQGLAAGTIAWIVMGALTFTATIICSVVCCCR